MLAKSVDVSKLKFSAPKTLGNQSRSVYVNYEGDKLRIQTPIMHLPYGVSDNEALAKLNKKPGDISTDAAQPKKYDLSVSFRGMDGSKGLQTLHDKMREIENAVIDHVFENRQVLLRDDYDGVKAFVKKLFTPIVKYDKDKVTGNIKENGYPPSMRVKIPYDDETEVFNFDSFDMDKNALDFKSIMTRLKGAKGRLIIQFGGVWIAGGRYGCTWRLMSAQFEVTSKANVDFIDDSDDEDTPKGSKTKVVIEDDEDVEEDAIHKVNEVTPPKKVMTAAAPAPAPTAVSESEESEEEEEEPEEDSESDDEPAPPPPPPPPAKAARKSTKKTAA
jgi:hypothetical protein